MDYQTIVARLAEWGHEKAEILYLNRSVSWEDEMARFSASVEPLARLRDAGILDVAGHRMLDEVQIAYTEQVLQAMRSSQAFGYGMAINEMLKIIEDCLDEMPDSDEPEDVD